MQMMISAVLRRRRLLEIITPWVECPSPESAASPGPPPRLRTQRHAPWAETHKFLPSFVPETTLDSCNPLQLAQCHLGMLCNSWDSSCSCLGKGTPGRGTEEARCPARLPVPAAAFCGKNVAVSQQHGLLSADCPLYSPGQPAGACLERARTVSAARTRLCPGSGPPSRGPRAPPAGGLGQCCSRPAVPAAGGAGGLGRCRRKAERVPALAGYTNK